MTTRTVDLILFMLTMVMAYGVGISKRLQRYPRILKIHIYTFDGMMNIPTEIIEKLLKHDSRLLKALPILSQSQLSTLIHWADTEARETIADILEHNPRPKFDVTTFTKTDWKQIATGDHKFFPSPKLYTFLPFSEEYAKVVLKILAFANYIHDENDKTGISLLESTWLQLDLSYEGETFKEFFDSLKAATNDKINNKVSQNRNMTASTEIQTSKTGCLVLFIPFSVILILILLKDL